MDPAWPEKITFGQAGVSLGNGRKTGFGQNSASCRPLRRRLHERPTDPPVADPRPAGIRHLARLDRSQAGPTDRLGASAPELREKIVETARRRDLDGCWCGDWIAGAGRPRRHCTPLGYGRYVGRLSAKPRSPAVSGAPRCGRILASDLSLPKIGQPPPFTQACRKLTV